jgi:hypothetical protein
MTARHQFKTGKAALLRGLDFGRRRRAAGTVIAAMLLVAGGATAAGTNDLSEAEIEGRQLARQLLEQWPATNFTQSGVLRIRDGKGKRAEVPVQFQISVTASNWQTVYATQITGTNNDMDFSRTHFGRLTITHNFDRPNVYTIPNVNPPPTDTNECFNLAGSQTMTAFAGSDFWMADLGLEFFHWPVQKLLKREFKRGCGCRVLESTNPHPSANGYTRVVSWIDNETGGIVQAEGYDARGKLLKEFAPKSFKKVNGQWELQEMEISNKKTGSRTRLEFDLPKE